MGEIEKNLEINRTFVRKPMPPLPNQCSAVAWDKVSYDDPKCEMRNANAADRVHRMSMNISHA